MSATFTSAFILILDTPVAVNQTIQQSIKFLNENILDKHLQPWNAFFSGSGKGQEVKTTIGNFIT